MIVCVDQNGCIGCGLCANVCPDIFQIGLDGLAHAAKQPEPWQEEDARRAADNCPVSVIGVEE